MRDRRPFLLLSFVGFGCGPSAQEIGATVLASAPIVHLVTMVVLFVIVAVRRRHQPRIGFPWQPHVGIVAGLSVLALAWADAVDLDLLLAAIAIFGAGYLTVTMLAWRIAFAIRQDERVFLLPSLLAIVLCVAPAIALASGEFDTHQNASDIAIAYWVILSGWGFAPFAVVIPCALEAWWRGRRQPLGFAEVRVTVERANDVVVDEVITDFVRDDRQAKERGKVCDEWSTVSIEVPAP